MVVKWGLYPNFKKEEFDCKHTGENMMRPEFMEILQTIRTEFGRPMVINSGYRHPSHPDEAKKDKPGVHSLGIAVDVKVSGWDAVDLVRIALHRKISRIGVAQKGLIKDRYIHLDIGDLYGFPISIWSY